MLSDVLQEIIRFQIALPLFPTLARRETLASLMSIEGRRGVFRRDERTPFADQPELGVQRADVPFAIIHSQHKDLQDEDTSIELLSLKVQTFLHRKFCRHYGSFGTAHNSQPCNQLWSG